MVISRKGEIIVCPVETLVMKKTVQEASKDFGDQERVGTVIRSMMSGESGVMEIRGESSSNNHVYFAPVERTGWSMSIVIPDSEIFGEIKKTRRLVELLQIFGLLMLVTILGFAAKSQNEYKNLSEKKEKMEDVL